MENAIKAIIAFVILGILIYIGSQILPIYMDHWNLEDEIKEMVQYAFTGSAQDVEKRLTKEISSLLQEMGAVYQQKNIKVKRDGARKISVEVWYERPHNLPIIQNPKQFYIYVENKVVEGL